MMQTTPPVDSPVFGQTHLMSELTIRPIAANDLPGILAVQQACYGDGFLEPGDALASRWARSLTEAIRVLQIVTE